MFMPIPRAKTIMDSILLLSRLVFSNEAEKLHTSRLIVFSSGGGVLSKNEAKKERTVILHDSNELLLAPPLLLRLRRCVSSRNLKLKLTDWGELEIT